jgi:DNA-binding transcriptional MerR regulator
VKSPRGQRLYRRKDLEAIFTIKGLLYDKKFTIDGARMYLSKHRRVMDEIKAELREIVELLEGGT